MRRIWIVRGLPVSIGAVSVVAIALHTGNSLAQAVALEKAAAPVTAVGAVFTVSSGSYYLSKNIVMSGGNRNAINITGPNVSIDFRGYGIIGKNSAAGIGQCA